MDLALLQQLETLASFGRDNDARESTRSRRMLNITPETGRLLWILVRSTAAKRILEVGTSNAYSTLWLADAARHHGGSVTTLEHDPAKVTLARQTLEQAGLDASVHILQGDAADLLPKLMGPFDLVFLDADRESYLSYLTLVVPKLRAGGLLIADNATSHAQELAGYLDAIHAHPQLFSVTVPIGNGEQIAVKL